MLWFSFHMCMFLNCMISPKALCGICQSFSERRSSLLPKTLCTANSDKTVWHSLPEPHLAEPSLPISSVIFSFIYLLSWLSACGHSQLNCLHFSCFQGELPSPALRCHLLHLDVMASLRRRRLVNSIRPAVSPGRIRGWRGDSPFPPNSWYCVQSVCQSTRYGCPLPPLPLCP